MSKWFLSKVIAGAALGCASLLIASPAVAAASDGNGADHHKKGWIYSVPEPAVAGHKAYIVQICKKEQDHAWAWSKPTGKVKLEPHPFFTKKKAELPEEESEALEELELLKEKLKKKLKLKSTVIPMEDEATEDAVGEEAVEDAVEEEAVEDAVEEEAVEEKKVEEKKKEHGKEHGKKLDLPELLEKELKKKDHPYAYWAKVWIPFEVEPGVYKLKGSCAKGKLVVAPVGPIDGGDGGVLGTGTNAGLAAGGAGVMAVATLGGLALLRRRAADGTLA